MPHKKAEGRRRGERFTEGQGCTSRRGPCGLTPVHPAPVPRQAGITGPTLWVSRGSEAKVGKTEAVMLEAGRGVPSQRGGQPVVHLRL